MILTQRDHKQTMYKIDCADFFTRGSLKNNLNTRHNGGHIRPPPPTKVTW